MKKNIKIILLCFFFKSSFLLNASNLMLGGDTSKPIPKINKEFLIVAHIIKNESGLPVTDSATLVSVMKSVNELFKPINAKFTICEFRYIDYFLYDTLNGKHNRYKDLHNLYSVPRRINMFFVSDLIKFSIPKACGIASLGGINNNTGQACIDIACVTQKTIAHELGHFFDLGHTFDGSGTELVNGSNCLTAGDGICDTPADPYEIVEDPAPNDPGIEYVDGNCVFIYQKKDANGDYYDPDTGNIMSYYTECSCNKFSKGQYTKMANYYLSHPVAW